MKVQFIEGDGAIVAKEHPEGVDVFVSKASGGVLSLDAAEALARHILALVKAKRPATFTTWHQSPGRAVEHWAIHDAAGNLRAETWQAGPGCWVWRQRPRGDWDAGTESTREAAMRAALPDPPRLAEAWYQYYPRWYRSNKSGGSAVAVVEWIGGEQGCEWRAEGRRVHPR